MLDNEKKRNVTLKSDSVDAAIGRLRNKFSNIIYDDVHFGDYYHLIYMKDQFIYFQKDLINFDRENKCQVIFAIDDVVVDAYASMGRNARKFFHFNIRIEGEKNEEILVQRGAEYLFRLEKLLFSQGSPVLLFPPNAQQTRRHIEYYAVDSVKKNLSDLEDDIKKATNTAFQEAVKARGLYPEWANKNVKEEKENEDDLLHIVEGKVDKEDKNQSKIRNWSRNEKDSSIGKMAAKQLAKNNRVVDRFGDLFSNSSQIRFFSEFDFEALSVQAHDAVAFLREINDLRKKGVEDYSEITNGLYRVLYSLDRINKEKKDKDRRKSGSEIDTDGELGDAGVRTEDHLWAAALSATYVHVINSIFKNYRVNVRVHFVSHRTLVAQAVQAFSEDELLIPIRHPKLMASQIPEPVRRAICTDVEQLTSALDGFVRRAQGDQKISKGEMAEIRGNVSPSWTALKQKIYASEAGYDAQRYLEKQKELDAKSMSDGEALEALKFVSVLGDEDSAPQFILSRNLSDRIDELMWNYYKAQLGEVVLTAYHVEKREKEEGHWLVFPMQGKYRYVVKIPDGMFGWEERKGSPVKEIKIWDYLNKKSSAKSMTSDEKIFLASIASMVGGNWSVIENYLTDRRIQEVDDYRLQDECLFIKHLALRGLASQRRRDGRKSAEFLEESFGIIGHLVKRNPHDLRFRLAQAVIPLEAIVLSEINTVHKDEYFNIFGNDYMKKILAIIMGIISEVQGHYEGNLEQKTNGQKMYWKYMECRALQFLFTLYAIVWCGDSPNPMLDYHILVYSKEDKVDWGKRLSEYELAWKEYAYMVLDLKKENSREKDPERETVKTVVPAEARYGGNRRGDICIPEKYRAARFILAFSRLVFRYNFGENVQINALTPTRDRMQMVSDDFPDIYSALNELEQNCYYLSYNGIPRHQFRLVKKKMLPIVKSNMMKLIDGSIGYLIDDLDRMNIK
ncbi:MAG: hypothetical protein K9H25_21935 [Rhodospirillum sp.]|nr:hypothetical protein [Rhodospirillum sp.]MCF8491711.1 hypothetical protein [Rhodospirillum sp.]